MARGVLSLKFKRSKKIFWGIVIVSVIMGAVTYQ